MGRFAGDSTFSLGPLCRWTTYRSLLSSPSSSLIFCWMFCQQVYLLNPSLISPHKLFSLFSSPFIPVFARAATGHDIRSAINTLQFAALRTRQAQRTAARASAGVTGGAAGGASGGVGAVTLGHTLASMISSGLKDEQRDAFQVNPHPPPSYLSMIYVYVYTLTLMYVTFYRALTIPKYTVSPSIMTCTSRCGVRRYVNGTCYPL